MDYSMHAYYPCINSLVCSAYHLTVFNMQATRDNDTIVLPPHVHCYIPERDPMADFNVS